MWSCNGNDHHILFSNPKVHGIVMWLAATRSPTTNHMSTSIWFQEIKNYYSLKTNISHANCRLEDDSFPFHISLLRRQVHLHGGTSPRHEQTARRQLAFWDTPNPPKKIKAPRPRPEGQMSKIPLQHWQNGNSHPPSPSKVGFSSFSLKLSIHRRRIILTHIHVVPPVRRWYIITCSSTHRLPVFPSQHRKKQLSALIPYRPCMVYLHKMLLIPMVVLPKMLWICMVFMYREICKHPHGWYGNFRNVVRLAQAKIQDLFELL